MNLAKFPRRKYLQGATPIEPMPRLSRALGDKVNLYVKRDDLLPGAGGGNKTRKLEFCIAEALTQAADSIITCGAIQSNHCRLTLAWSIIEELDCHLILEERVVNTYKKSASGNNLLYKILGAKSIEVVEGGTDMAQAMEKTATDLRTKGKKTYIIPGGASNSTGGLGYVNCAEEVSYQLNQQQLLIDEIIVPSGSAGTHAGMLAGMVGLNTNIPITGINVSREKSTQESLVYELAQEIADKVKMTDKINREQVVCFDDYVGSGYSIPTVEMIEAVELFARNEAILLDPVYSGKAAAGLIDLVRNNHFAKGANVLFLHTGGSPALYAYKDIFE